MPPIYDPFNRASNDDAFANDSYNEQKRPENDPRKDPLHQNGETDEPTNPASELSNPASDLSKPASELSNPASNNTEPAVETRPQPSNDNSGGNPYGDSGGKESENTSGNNYTVELVIAALLVFGFFALRV
jgi:hypothetical protein